ncbi:unnamed protein product [Sphenostylis stenocarpa]|uniref:glucan endo-1,3-beta-D-glucosidase n=1 Tax=Sphenostylis stenocarpa TaxID=92480 RepID=A0AA86W6M4_9FABA|nr:unnamed protein product [Sphenostylis stenocarpa]
MTIMGSQSPNIVKLLLDFDPLSPKKMVDMKLYQVTTFALSQFLCLKLWCSQLGSLAMMMIRSVMTSCSFFEPTLLFLLSISDLVVKIHGLGFGINYGQIANNLPLPSQVAVLIQSLNVSRIKLYDADPNVLVAFSESNVEFVIGLGNEYIENMTNPSKAQTWIQQHVQPYFSQTKITCITVGNEVFNSNDTQLMVNLLPAMQTVHDALVSLGLDQQVTVTTAHSFNILSSSYPPSSGAFREDLVQYIQPLLDFHAQINSPFLINAYPFFTYKDNPNVVPLNYVLFQPNQGTIDPNTNLHYDNMLYAQIDAVYAAIKQMGHDDIQVRISETGWPSNGDPEEVGATPQNAALYNGNLLKRIEQKQGTPAKPSVPIDIYVFALFNEDLKPGPASERNYGLYYPNGSPVYNIGLKGYLPQMPMAAKSNILSVNLLVCIVTSFIFALELSRCLESESKKRMSEAEELPRSIVRRVVKDKLSRCSEDGEISVSKDSLLAFSESGRIFIHYLSATANDICKESKRQIISAEDVFKALEETEFSEFVRPLKASLEEFRKKNAGKKVAVSKGKEDEPRKKRKLKAESSDKGEASNKSDSSDKGEGSVEGEDEDDQ